MEACADPRGEPGSCIDCPLHWLDAAMSGPLGSLVNQAFTLMRRKNVGFPLPPAETLPADLVAAVEIVAEEQQDFMEERRSRDEEAEAVKRELGKVRRG